MIEDVRHPPFELSFYHTVEYAPGHRTNGWPVIVPIVEMIFTAMRALDFAGKRVLDIGCRDGALSFEAEKLGAASVLGIDYDLPLETTAFLTEALRSQARFAQRNLYDLRPETDGTFDVILLSGVLYHLRYPALGLRQMRDLLPDGGTLLVETATFADANRLPLLFCPTGSNSPYEPTSCSFYNITGFIQTAQSLGLAVASYHSLMNLAGSDPAPEAPLPIDRTVFVCRRDHRLDDSGVLGYWDGNQDAPSLPDWNGRRR